MSDHVQSEDRIMGVGVPDGESPARDWMEAVLPQGGSLARWTAYSADALHCWRWICEYFTLIS